MDTDSQVTVQSFTMVGEKAEVHPRSNSRSISPRIEGGNAEASVEDRKGGPFPFCTDPRRGKIRRINFL